MKNNYYKKITTLGIICCILWLVLVNTKPLSDFVYYNELAKQIANGGAWGNTYTSVGYPIVLGFIYKIFGSSLIVAKIFNLVLTLVNYKLLYSLLKKLDINETRRKIIYTLFVLFPQNIFYNSILASEILFTTIFLLVTLIYYSNIKLKYPLIGILVGINTMVKPFFILFFFAIFIVELGLKIKFLNVLKHSVTVLLVSLICVSPWLYRNTKLIGQFTTVSNNGGIVLYINNNSQNKYGRWMAAKDVENSVVLKEEYIKANMTEKNKMLKTSAKKWIQAHPLQFIGLGFKRLANTYFIPDDVLFTFNGANLNKIAKILIISYTALVKIIVFLFAIIGIIIKSKNIIKDLFKKNKINAYDLYILVCFYMFTCVYFVTEGQGRYSFPTIFIAIYLFSESFMKTKFCKTKIENDISTTLN